MHKNAIWDRTLPHLHINCSLHMCGRVQGSQIFKRNSIISICSKVMAFLVISLSPSSPRHPRHPHVVPVSFLLSPLHPHSPQMVPMWSPWLWSPWSPRHPCHPHVISVIPMSSPCCPRHPHSVPIAPRRSPCGPHGCGLHGLHPMLSPWSLWSPSSPRHPHHPYVIPVILTSSPHHLEGPHIISNPPDTHCTHPPPPWGVGAPNQ